MQASSSAPTSPTAKSLTATSASPATSLSAAATASVKGAKSTIRPTSDSSCEIEEISKKISEHADAIYRTWKCRGLAPTELLDFYTSASAVETNAIVTAPDFFGATKAVVADEVTSTEGLQQLVNTFVIKDKQQRGAKVHNSNMSSSSSNKKSPILTTQTDVLGDHLLLTKQQKTANIMKQAKPVTQRPSAILLPDTTKTATPTSTVATKSKEGATMKKTSTTVTTNSSKTTAREATAAATTTARSNACVSNDKNYQGTTKEHQQQQQQQQAPTMTKTKTGASKLNNKFVKDAPTANDLNLSLNLDLDLNNLTQLQTENLLKIKELLQQESVVADKPKKTSSASSSLTAPSSKITATTTTTSTGNKKRTPNEQASERVTATAVTTTTTTARSGIATTSNHDNAKIAVNSQDVAADKNSNCIKKVITTTPIIAANRTQINEQQQQQQQQEKLIANSSSNLNQNKIKAEEKSIKSKVIKAPSSSEPNNNNSKIINNNSSSSSSSSNKNLKEKTVIAVKNSAKLAPPTNVLMPATNATQTTTTATETNSTTTSTTKTTTTTAVNEMVATSTATATTPTATCSIPAATSPPATENVMEVARSSMPAPTKVKSARPLTNGQDKNLGRPILTRGSVAERVLMFEKCPDVRHSFLNTKRPDPSDTPPKAAIKVKLHSTPPAASEHNSLQREIRISGKNVYIPRFYFPHGKPQPQIAIERTLRGILSAFDTFPNNQVTKDELPRILKLCGLPFYWRMPVMVFCQHGNSGLVERQRFVEFWKQMNVYCHDNASRFVYILSRGQRFRSYIVPEDLAPLVQDVVDTHPGLAFLKEATEFHSRYVHTVIARIFYSVNRCWSGKISICELKKSDLLEIITLLEEEDDINQIMAFFSYEHFYVIYCKFWELDRDHDLLINQEDLARHSDHALSTRIIERIFSGCVTRSDNKKDPDDEPKMSYTDFVWFLLSEEDKRTPTAIEYWFRCMDVDGDGVLSMYELEYFYEEQQQRMESIGIETLPFEDCLCQMLDMIKPQNNDCITLGDLKRCKMTHVFFDTFFNLEKYLDHEQRDPFASQRDEYASDWDRFAAQEYELLITEEND